MTELPLIRFQRGNTTHAKILYEGPDSDGTVLKFTQDDPILVVIGPDGRLYPNVEVTRLPHMGRIGIELKPSGGLPTLHSKHDGWGGTLFWPIDPETLLRTIGDRPITIPEDTPIGTLMLFGVMFITVTTIYERPWVPPGWEIVNFSMFNSVIPSGALPSATSIAFAVYKRICQAGDPGSKLWGYAINTDQPYPTVNDDPPQDPWTGFREGDWMGHLRIYDHATIGRTDKVKTHEILWDWGPITTDPRDNPGATESDGTPIVADPAIRTPHNLLGTVGARQVEFFMVNQWGWFDIDLASGGQNKMISGGPEDVHPIEAADPINKARIVSEGPFMMMASEEFVDTTSGGELILLPDPHWTPPTAIDEKTWIHVDLTGPHHNYHADIQIHKFKSPLQLFDPQLGVFDKVAFFVRPVQIKGNLPTRLEHSIEEVENFDAFPLGGINFSPDARHRTGIELDGDVELQYSASPTKVGPPGPLGRDIAWVKVAHWAGGSLSEFTIPDQWDHGNIVAGPAMQVLNGVLTTADASEVRFIFQGFSNPGDYVGDKYAAIWTGAPPSADQTKLRVKLSSMIGNFHQQVPFVDKLFGIACNMQDRQRGTAFYLSDGDLGWTRDLRRLGEVQWTASVTGGGQNIVGLTSHYWDAGGNLDTDGTPISYGTDRTFPEFLSNVLFIEMWRNGNTLSVGIWEDDPDTGGQPVWREDRDLTLSTIDQANFDPSVSHHWGVTAAALDPTWHSNSGLPMGFAEFTMYRAP